MADARKSPLELIHIWVDLISKVLGGAALLVAAWWTYANFTVERTHDPTMEVIVQPTARAIRGNQMLLNVDVFMENIGRVAILPRFQDGPLDKDLGLEISIVEMEPQTDRSSAANQENVAWFDWTEGAGAPRHIMHKQNLLATNEDFRNRRYQLNPGVRYREAFACLVEPNKLYAVRARFWTESGSVADLVYVDTFSAAADEKSAVPLATPETSPSTPVREPVETVAKKQESENSLR